MSFIIIKTKQEAVKVMLTDILYIISHPSKPHYVQIVTEAETYDCLHKLQNLEELYPDHFVRCHRCSLVNISKVKAINFKEKYILLGEKEEHHMTFSRHRYRDILRQWTNKGGM